jgi:orotidine-5'-phosphate decarboxylase
MAVHYRDHPPKRRPMCGGRQPDDVGGFAGPSLAAAAVRDLAGRLGEIVRLTPGIGALSDTERDVESTGSNQGFSLAAAR